MEVTVGQVYARHSSIFGDCRAPGRGVSLNTLSGQDGPGSHMIHSGCKAPGRGVSLTELMSPDRPLPLKTMTEKSNDQL